MGFYYVLLILLVNMQRCNYCYAFQSILNDSKRKLNKMWIDKGSEFYNRSMTLWLEKNDIEVYSTHNEGKSVLAERFIRTLKSRAYKYMTSKMCILKT